MRTKMIIVLGMIFLIGVVSAGLVDYLSNVVTGEVEVKGPVFYLDGPDSLLINNVPLSSTPYQLSSGSNYYGKRWVTLNEDNFGGIDFYDTEIEFTIDVEVSNLTEPRGVDLEFGFIKTNGDARPICSTQFISINQNGDYTIPCELYSSYAKENINKFYFRASGMGDTNIIYKLKTRDSFIEITGVR